MYHLATVHIVHHTSVQSTKIQSRSSLASVT